MIVIFVLNFNTDSKAVVSFEKQMRMWLQFCGFKNIDRSITLIKATSNAPVNRSASHDLDALVTLTQAQFVVFF